MPCPFTGPKMFCVDPNFLSQPKNLTAFKASSKTFVPAQKPILLNANHLFVWHKMFVTATICKLIFGLAQNIWTSPKHFGTCKRTRHLCLALSMYQVCAVRTKCELNSKRKVQANFIALEICSLSYMYWTVRGLRNLNCVVPD